MVEQELIHRAVQPERQRRPVILDVGAGHFCRKTGIHKELWPALQQGAQQFELQAAITNSHRLKTVMALNGTLKIKALESVEKLLPDATKPTSASQELQQSLEPAKH
ncbi:hypothetical protein M6G63_26035 (plasmid) [Pseudomonas sp. BYT-5]|uniref:hypothetical protein n=1 Tax=unclassified Pseudomonas TaxID=196821 RepID=UPI0020209C33|nr:MULTISPECIES: hypothetical protein [unclassified Pseudomonas]URD45477.1 hypothetical protein M6G63_26035 [Pseudomonas sp. BYT-5]